MSCLLAALCRNSMISWLEAPMFVLENRCRSCINQDHVMRDRYYAVNAHLDSLAASHHVCQAVYKRCFSSPSSSVVGILCPPLHCSAAVTSQVGRSPAADFLHISSPHEWRRGRGL